MSCDGHLWLWVPAFAGTTIGVESMDLRVFGAARNEAP